MAIARRVIALAALLQCSVALVEFSKSKLYDETDFAVPIVEVGNFCETVGCRIYVSVPEPYAAVAKHIMVQDDNYNDTSLYDISKMNITDQKDFYLVEGSVNQLSFMNTNPGYTTAPIAVWVVRGDASNIGGAIVYEADSLNSAPASIGVVTVMSAAPFTLRTKTDGPMLMVSSLVGYDAITSDDGDQCINVFNQMDPESYSDVQIAVQSPMITFFYDNVDYDTTIALTADVGKDTPLDFTGISFAASPGYIGCRGQQKYYSSLYDATTTYKYSKFNRLYDVAISSIVMTTDAAHPVTIKDSTNENEFKLYSTPTSISLHQTNNLEISWTRNDDDPDQSFVILLTPSNQQIDTTLAPTTEATTEPTTTVPVPEQTTTEPAPDSTTTISPLIDTTTITYTIEATTSAIVSTTSTSSIEITTTILPSETDSTTTISDSTTTVPPTEHTPIDFSTVGTSTNLAADSTTTIPPVISTTTMSPSDSATTVSPTGPNSTDAYADISTTIISTVISTSITQTDATTSTSSFVSTSTVSPSTDIPPVLITTDFNIDRTTRDSSPDRTTVFPELSSSASTPGAASHGTDDPAGGETGGTQPVPPSDGSATAKSFSNGTTSRTTSDPKNIGSSTDTTRAPLKPMTVRTTLRPLTLPTVHATTTTDGAAYGSSLLWLVLVTALIM